MAADEHQAQFLVRQLALETEIGVEAGGRIPAGIGGGKLRLVRLGLR
jgi:hypothetical protein